MEHLTEPVYYNNSKWAVTGYGMEAVDRSYPIEKERLANIRKDLRLPEWPLHMCDKNWVDGVSFLQVFAIALSIHKCNISSFSDDWFILCEKRIKLKTAESCQFDRALTELELTGLITVSAPIKTYSMDDFEKANELCKQWNREQSSNSLDAILKEPESVEGTLLKSGCEVTVTFHDKEGTSLEKEKHCLTHIPRIGETIYFEKKNGSDEDYTVFNIYHIITENGDPYIEIKVS